MLTTRREALYGIAKRLAKMQNQCLRAVTGVYKVTPVAILETKTYTLSLDLYLNTKLASFRCQHRIADIEELVKSECEMIKY